MTYTPNPADVSQPLENVKASTAAAEFRALKAYIQTLTPNGARKASVRQTVRSGLSANGLPVYITPTSPTSLNLNFVHGGRDTVISFANGFDSTGDAEKVSVLSTGFATVNNILPTSLPINQLSYIYADYSTDAAVTFGHTPVPPQYAVSFEAHRQYLLHFEAATLIDAYSNTWAIAGGASLSTAQKKFGTQSVNCATGGISTSAVGQLPDSWTFEAFVQFTTLPTAGNRACIFQYYNASNVGAQLQLYNNAGTIKLEINASSDGTTNNITSAQVGTKTTWSTGTWYHIVLAYDAFNGKLLAYVDGGVDYTQAVAARICLGTTMRLGYNNAAGNPLAGYIDEFRFSPCCRYPNGNAYTVPTLAFSMDRDFFSILNMEMSTPTVESSVAGTPPTLQKINRVYLGEVQTNGTVAHTVNLYGFNGTYTRTITTTLTANTPFNFNHQLGFPQEQLQYLVKLFARAAISGFSPGQMLDITGSAYSDGAARGYSIVPIDKNNVMVVIGTDIGFFRPDTGTAATNLANWMMSVTARRTW